MPIDHASIIVPMAKVDDYADFLKAALAPIGYKEWMRPVKWAVGLGDTTPNFWINGVEAKGMSEDAIVEMVNGQHFAFLAESREQVQQFHEEAIKAGATDNGAPGPRPQFGPKYFAAFVKDPVCGYNVEVLCRN